MKQLMKKLLLLTLILLLVTMIACTQVAQAIKLGYREKATKYKAGKDYKGSIVVDGLKRTYLLHIHKGFNPAEQSALVLGFHGGAGSGKKFAKQTGFSAKADEEGFIAVYPDGIKHNWNDGRDTTDAYKAGADDIKFVRALVTSLTGKLPIDTNRIYATGVSNGGIFSHRLGCEMADVFAAIGPVIGSIATNLAPKCNPTSPISVVVIQGTKDPFIPLEGGDTKHKTRRIGDGGLVESADSARQFWASKNSCIGTHTISTLPQKDPLDNTIVRQINYVNCRDNTEVRYYIVEGMGHGWPPKGREVRESISGPTSHNIDATQVIWEFFEGHPKSTSTGIIQALEAGDYGREVPGWPNRPYDLHIPPQYNPSQPVPVILVLHGGGGNSRAAAKLTCPNGNLEDPKCFNNLADREGFIVVYPNGNINPKNVISGRRWNAGGGKNGYSCAGGFTCATNLDDIKYFNALLDDLGKVVAIDDNRIYATGLSNGGSMTHRLGCQLSNRIAAIASLAAGNQFSTVEECSPDRAVPVLQIHGTDDPFWLYLGGEGRATAEAGDKGIRISIPDTVKGWVSRNSCSSLPTETLLEDKSQNDGTRVKKEVYSQCRDNAGVIFYNIEGGGHTWPDGWQYLPERTIGKTSKDINANEIIWNFFKEHSKI